MKKNILTIMCLGLSLTAFQKSSALPCSYFNNLTLPPHEIASVLGWVPTHTNLCGGYYQEPATVLACAHPAQLNAAETTITAERTLSFSTMGTSQLEGNIVVTQPGRKITAQKATLYRDPVTHEIAQIVLEGDVHYYEAGKQLVAQRVFVDLSKKTVRLQQVLYRLAKATRREVLNAWGQAQSVERKSASEINLTNATYTTCSPVNQTWMLSAQRFHINREAGWGEAVNSYLYIHRMPVLWVPYFSFPVDKHRKTGFLFPTLGYSDDNGVHVRFPYYLNLAPNYDLTLTPGYIFARGAVLESRFRYITCRSNGVFNLEVLPYDKKFAAFRRNAPFINDINPTTIPFLNRIHNASNSRGALSFRDNSTYNLHWWGNVNLNLVSDDYYLQDFAYNPYASDIDQLLNQAELNYASDNWRFLGRLQTYQTLHPINQQPILDQYSRLPQLFITSDFPNYPNHLDYQINSELVYFDHRRAFITHEPITTGERLHVQPSVSFPIITPATFFIPKLQLDATLYDLDDRINQPHHINRILPIFDIDTGVYFDRYIGSYTQTLEPRFFYLFVPETNQNDIPIFDTTLPLFSFATLFRTNRFVGYDRVGDANQLSVALTTRFLKTQTGFQKFRASIGQIYYFQKPTVCLTPDCRNDMQAKNNFSPFVGEMSYNFNPSWDTIANIAVDSDSLSLDNAAVMFHYKPDQKHIFNIGYDFVRKGDLLTAYAQNTSKDNLNRINLALAWQLDDHWQVLANWNYNLSHGHPQAYFYGLQYDSCCWALRFVASRIVTAENINDSATYQTNIFVQLQLKGLGNIGNSDPGSLLTSSIFGYQDMFRG